jgi:hypothetical protein
MHMPHFKHVSLTKDENFLYTPQHFIALETLYQAIADIMLINC